MPNLTALVLRILLTKKGWHAFHHLVVDDTFDNTEFRRIYKHIAGLHEHTEHDLSVSAVQADMEIQYAQRQDMLANTIMALQAVETAEDIPHDLAERLVKKFLERTASMQIAQHIAQSADKEDFSITSVADLAQRAMEAGGRVQQTVTDIFESEVSGAPESRPTRYSLGVSRRLDSSLRGGTSDGELFIYLAPPSRGKTAFLCKTGATSAAAGLRVLHVTLEINTRKVIERYDQCWTGLSTEEFETPTGQEAVQEARSIVREKGGAVWIVNWSYQNVCANDIGALVRRMGTQDMFVDMIIIDYLELMTPNKIPGREMRQTYSAIGKETRSLAVNLGIPVLTAWQANRGGSEELLLSQKDVSESWDIIKIADTIVGLNQSLEELRNRRMRVNVIKQRESTDRSYFTLYCDLERMVVRDERPADQIDHIRNEVRSVLEEAEQKPGEAASLHVGEQGNPG